MPFPADSYPEAAFSAGILGGAKLVRVTKDASGSDARSKIAVIGKNAIPKIETAGFRFAKKTEVQADHAMVARVLKTAKVYTALAEKTATGQNRKTIDSFYRQIDAVKRNLKAGNATSWSEGKDTATLIDQLHPVMFNHFDLTQQVITHCLDVAKTLVKFAELAMKAKPAAAE
jgi:hypothetical protein